MSDWYELGFTFELKQDLSRETRATLTYMTRSSDARLRSPTLKHPFFHIEDSTPVWTDLISNPRNYDEKVLGEICGSVFADDRLTFRGLIHEDPFSNTWHSFSDWLYSISSSFGLIGYYNRTMNDKRITLIYFQPEGVSQSACEDYSELAPIESLIFRSLESWDAKNI